MKYSRTYRTCQNVIRHLLQQYGFKDHYHPVEIDIAISRGAGGDPRTLQRYRVELRKLTFLIPDEKGNVGVNLKQLDYQQLSMDDGLKVLAETEPP